ncbi:MAG: hypothetical protein HQK81_05755 [Desulfovibrionaceae bacterium]|nr:hypothetical protein [Desulfovibrionaceae bacterium]MBF0513554.1 hypothetical protein [Desulfovibrionaceae bacterium]
MSISDLTSVQATTQGLDPGLGETPLQPVEGVLAQGREQTQTLASQVGQGMSRLQQLAAGAPAAFQTVAATIAGQLTDAAKNARDPRQTAFLEHLAKKFLDASQSGDMSYLQFNEDHPQPFGTNASAFGKYNDLHDSGLFSLVGGIVAKALPGAGGAAADVFTATDFTFANPAAGG